MSIDIQTNYADGSTIYTLTDEASFTLPSANSYDKLVIRNDSDDTIPIYAYGAETVDGRASFDLGPNICVTIQSIQQGGWIALQFGQVTPAYFGFPAETETFQFVSRIEDLPAAVNNVITLNGGAWLFTAFVDLAGARIVCEGDTAILGTSSETAGVTSTGLTAGASLITSTASLPMQNIRITVPTGCKGINIDATGNASAAIDWDAVNFVSGEVGTVKNVANFIQTNSSYLSGAHGLILDGTIGTIGISNTLFSLPVGTMLTIPATATVTRRFRVIYSSFVATSGNTALNVSTSASIPVEGYILDTVNFSGGGTYTAGVQYTDNKSLFQNCRGINNSGEFAHMTMNGNSTATDIVTQGVAVKIAGTTTLQPDTQKFSHSNNRLTYSGALSRSFKVFVTASINASANTRLGLYVAKNGSVITNSENYTTAGAANRSENALSQTVVTLATNDYVEVWVENDSSTTDVTVTDLSVIVEALN